MGQGEVLLNSSEWTVTTVRPFHFSNAAHIPLQCGPPIDHTKNRYEVVAEFSADANLETVYNSIAQAEVQGVLVAQFENTVAALVFKNRNKTIKLPGTIRAVESGRRNQGGVAKQVKHFLSAKRGYGNFQLQHKGDEAEMPDFEEACEELWHIDSMQMHSKQRL